MTTRFAFVLSHVTPTDRVLHIGCCGDEWLFDTVWKEGYPLHKALADRVGNERLVGMDINRERLAEMSDMGYAVVHGTAEDLDASSLLGDEPADVVVAGEIIEHLSLPGQFLEDLGRCLAPGGRAILTTPNAYGFWTQTMNLLGRSESTFVSKEHVAWYSAQTLGRLLDRHGWTIRQSCYLCPDPNQLASRRLRWIKSLPERVPRLRPILGVVAECKGTRASTPKSST